MAILDNTKNGIYKIINELNGKIYIGSTFCSGGFKRRWTVHKSSLKNNRHPNKHLQHSWNKYGDIFNFEIIEIIDKKEILIEREQYFIDFFKSFDDKIGYNISRVASAPMLGLKHTDEAKKKISKASEGNKYALGFIHTIETRKLMTIARHNETKETREKRSLSLIGNKNSLGVKPVNIKPIIQLDINDIIIKEWESITEAANFLKLHRANITLVCNGKRNLCGGFKWKYKIK